MEIVKRYERGEDSYESLANEVGVNSGTIRKWFVQYKNLGASAFDEESRNKSYTKEFKEAVVQAYLNGKGSYLDVATAFDIPSDTTVINWVKKYNGHIEQTDYKPMGDVYMTKSRNTTQEERKEIVDYCLEHDKNYRLTAKVFEVPYANVYQWV